MYKFKVIIIGPSAVGKTSLLYRFVKNEFQLQYKLTLGANFLSKTLEIKPNKAVYLQIWDIGGQEKFKILYKNFYEGANGALLVFDLSRESTFKKMSTWLFEMYIIMGTKIPFILVGNKVDLFSEIGEIVNRNAAEWFAKQENASYIETSAKTGDNVEQAFIKLVNQMIKD
ncbi:MAG: GTP-binding protein [Promethearchaeota archaeon]